MGAEAFKYGGEAQKTGVCSKCNVITIKPGDPFYWWNGGGKGARGCVHCAEKEGQTAKQQPAQAADMSKELKEINQQLSELKRMVATLLPLTAAQPEQRQETATPEKTKEDLDALFASEDEIPF